MRGPASLVAAPCGFALQTRRSQRRPQVNQFDLLGVDSNLESHPDQPAVDRVSVVQHIDRGTGADR